MCAGLVAVAAGAEPRLEHVSTFVWDRPEAYFGGWSAIEVRDGGERFLAVGDDAQIYDGRLERTDGLVTGVGFAPVGALADVDGVEYFRKDDDTLTDSEGLAILPDGFAVSFERDHRVMIYGDNGTVERLALPREVQNAGENGAVEALAVDAEERLIAIPETVPRGADGFPIWRQAITGWETVGVIAKSSGFLPTGADVGPEGGLFVLERAFRGVGFRSRVRVFDLNSFDAEGIVLWQSRTRAFDNLEGIAVWQADDGLRITMISDDNYNWFQRTEIVEFRLTE